MKTNEILLNQKDQLEKQIDLLNCKIEEKRSENIQQDQIILKLNQIIKSLESENK